MLPVLLAMEDDRGSTAPTCHLDAMSNNWQSPISNAVALRWAWSALGGLDEMNIFSVECRPRRKHSLVFDLEA